MTNRDTTVPFLDLTRFTTLTGVHADAAEHQVVVFDADRHLSGSRVGSSQTTRWRIASRVGKSGLTVVPRRCLSASHGVPGPAT